MAKSRFADSLLDEDELEVSVIRENGKTRTLPIWFTVKGSALHLLPMYGLKTLWYQDLERSGKLQLRAKTESIHTVPRIIRDSAEIERIKETFGQKYGKTDVSRYYPTSEVALEIPL